MSVARRAVRHGAVQVTATMPGTVSDAAKVTAGNVTADNDDSASATTTMTGT